MFVCPVCGRLAPAAGFCSADGEALIARTDELQGQAVGSYRIAREIGRGGMGQVYQGVHPSIGSRVAIKILSRESLEYPEFVQRFFDEARAVNLIRHEGIVNILDLAHLPDGRPYIVMEYLDGQTLRAVLAAKRTPFDAVARVLSEVLDALAAAHSKGIVHRDLKPDNIFVTPAGRAKVLDFGIAKLRPELTGQRAATRVGAVFGTPQYMSPEQAVGMPVDARTDLYSVGVVLYESIAGRLPFEGRTMSELLQKHVAEQPQPPSQLRPSVPSALDQVVMRALAKDPGQRFASAAEMRAALDRAVRESGLTAGGAGVAAMAGTPLRTGPTGTEGRYAVPPTERERSASDPRSPGLSATSGPGMAAAPYVLPSPYALPPVQVAPHVQPGAVGYGVESPSGGHGLSPGEAAYGLGGARQGPMAVSPGFTPAMAGVPIPVPGPVAKRSKAPIFVMLGCAGLGVLVAFVLAGLWFLSRALLLAAREPDADSGEGGLVGVAAGQQGPGVSVAATTAAAAGTAPGERPGAGIDLRRVDVQAHLPKALAIAQEAFPDAQLLRIDAVGLRSDGTVDVTASTSNFVLYRFRSPSRSQPPPGHPQNVEFRGPCTYYVGVYPTGAMTHVVDSQSCSEPLLPLPRCTVAEVWAKAVARGAATGNVVGQVGYWADDAGKPRWFASIPPFSSFVPDDCGQVAPAQPPRSKSKVGSLPMMIPQAGF